MEYKNVTLDCISILFNRHSLKEMEVRKAADDKDEKTHKSAMASRKTKGEASKITENKHESYEENR
jgi:hypothetical protein